MGSCFCIEPEFEVKNNQFLHLSPNNWGKHWKTTPIRLQKKSLWILTIKISCSLISYSLTFLLIWSELGTVKELRGASRTELFLQAPPTSLYRPGPSIQALDLSCWTRNFIKLEKKYLLRTIPTRSPPPPCPPPPSPQKQNAKTMCFTVYSRAMGSKMSVLSTLRSKPFIKRS